MQVQLVPRENANDNTLEIIKWHVSHGSLVEVGDILADLESSKANINVFAEYSGYIFQHNMAKTKVSVGSPLVNYFSTQDAFKNFNSSKDLIFENEVKKDGVSSKRFSSAAKELLQEKKILESEISLTGVISKARLEQFLSPYKAEEKKILQDVRGINGLKREDITSSKLQEISLLTSGQTGGINSSLTIQWDSSLLRSSIEKHSAFAPEIYPVLYYEIAQLIAQFPKFNAFYREQAIYYYGHINLAIALDLGQGLKAPVLRRVDNMTPYEIYQKVNEFGIRYLENKLNREDLSEPTVTLSDLASEDILYFQPLLNHAQSVIFGVGGDRKKNITTVTIVFDHRVLTGREVSLFLNELRKRMHSYCLPFQEKNTTNNITDLN